MKKFVVVNAENKIWVPEKKDKLYILKAKKNTPTWLLIKMNTAQDTGTSFSHSK